MHIVLEKYAVYPHWTERLFFCGCWGQYIFFLPFKTCSVELVLAKDIATNTIWHGELWQSGKLMKWIENVRVLCMFWKKQNRDGKKKERNSSSVGPRWWSMVTSCLLNPNSIADAVEMVLGQLAVTNENLSK